MPAPDRRTIGELLADSDALARETLLDARPEIAPAMVRSWNQLVASAAHLWAALVAAGLYVEIGPDGAAAGCRGGDRSQRSRWALARAWTDRRSPVRDCRQPFPGTASDRARRPPFRPANTDRHADTPDIHGQVMHTLYVAAHGTAVGLGGYVTELQHRLEVDTRRRQPMAERHHPRDHRGAGHDRPLSRVRTARRGVHVRAATPFRGPWPAESGGAGHAAGNSLGCLGGSSAPHPGRQPGSSRLGADRPRAGTHHQHHKRHHRSRSHKGPYRRRCDAAAGAGARGKPGCLEQVGETLG